MDRRQADFKKRYLCSGGPFAGQEIWLCTRSTAVLRFRPWYGRYVADPKNQYLIWEHYADVP